MYIEFKGDSIVGPARIGWVTSSGARESVFVIRSLRRAPADAWR